MSKKWQRNKAWEDANLTGAWTPLRLVLRAFSSIPLAVVLLLFVSLYATLASVPVGMIARIPTLLIVSGMYLALIGLPMLLALWFIRTSLRERPAPLRFLLMFVSVVVLGIGLTLVWRAGIWPQLKYHTTDGSGFMLFSDFVEKYKSTTVRRLPILEMTELEFYAWWPMRLALILFVINMVVATIRRIEFNFKNLGVLSVHTGIVIIALGSIFYQRFKLEGDTLLPAATQENLPGPAQRAFYDREDVALYVAQARTPNAQPQFEQRPLNELPLYNAYSVEAGMPDGAETLSDILGREILDTDEGRTINQEVPSGPGTLVDPDIKFRVVGFAPYAELDNEWFQADPPAGATTNPYRRIDLYYTEAPDPDQPIFNFNFFLGDPANRTRSNELMAIEYTRGMDAQRWNDLRQEFRTQFQHGLIIEVPGTNTRIAVPVGQGTRIPLVNTGWTVVVDQLAPEPPFPIITPGYENATSSVAIVTLIKQATGDEPEKRFSRWVFHRFPELNQDLAPNPGGAPIRSDPDPEIRVSYVDASKLQIYLDEYQDDQGETRIRAIVRQPTGALRTVSTLNDNRLLDLIPNPQDDRLDLHMSASWEHAASFMRPIPTPFEERDKSLVGSYAKALVGVEVSLNATETRDAWSEIIWLPFAQFAIIQQEQRTRVALPDGRMIMLVFGRYQRMLPGFELALVDFEMIAYDHRGAPRDYQSIVRVMPNPFYAGPKPDFQSFEHVVKLNNPLRAPYHWDPDKSWISNTITRLRAGMDPNQFKLSQASWDRDGWTRSQEMVDQGMLEKPRANFTVLGVGNNPGIHVIAFGSILMSIGIPWAFYLKPYLVRREKNRLAALHKQGKLKEAEA
ncbi:MAG: hypothetical protein ACX94C_10155 [Phycisphaerales bacterium]